MKVLHRAAITAATLSLLATPAFAHTGVGATHGFAHGFTHPLLGIDHALAMVMVGLFASLLGGRALWAVPATFVGMMLVGGALGLSGTALPLVEVGIALSLVAVGAAVAWDRPWSVSTAMALAGVFAVFHGYAHGAEMPVGAGALSYAAGFAVATALLHLGGIGIGLAIRAPAVIRSAGAAVACAGLALLIV